MLKKIVDLSFLFVLLFSITFLQHDPLITNQTVNSKILLVKPEQFTYLQQNNRQDTPFLINHGSRDKKEIALTFDADMTTGMRNELLAGQVHSWYNQQLINELENSKTAATLYLTGLWVQQYPTITKQLASNPLFEIGNHTWDHSAFGGNCYGLPIIPLSEDKSEIQKTQQEIKTITGLTPTTMRFPGGCYNLANLNIVKRLGLKVVNWDVIGGDSYLKKSKDIENTILSAVTNGSIIVLHMHDPEQHIAGNTAEAIPTIIGTLRKRGYTFVKISELFNTSNEKISTTYLQKYSNSFASSQMPLTPSVAPYLTRNLNNDL